MDPALAEVNRRIQNAIDHLKLELGAIRAGRANPTLIENIPVEVYGGRMKLVELGTISATQPTLLTVQIWDVSIVNDIIKAVQKANLGINPSSEGQTIRLPIPPLTEERREEFIRLAYQKLEELKVHVRQIRQEMRESWEEQMKGGEFGEDEFGRRSKLLQELVDKAGQQAIDLVKQKEEELGSI